MLIQKQILLGYLVCKERAKYTQNFCMALRLLKIPAFVIFGLLFEPVINALVDPPCQACICSTHNNAELFCNIFML